MRTKKKSLLALILVLVMVLLSGCGGMSKDDAKAYTQAVLDAQYKGEFKEYMEQTDSTEKEAKEMYEGNLDEMLAGVGIDESSLSAEMVENYKTLFLDLAKKVDYKIGDVKEADDDAYTVDVKIKPLMLEGLDDQVMSAVEEEIADITEVPSQEEINELVYGKMYDVLTGFVDNPSYGDEETITLHVKPDKDGVYYIPDEDLETLDNATVKAE